MLNNFYYSKLNNNEQVAYETIRSALISVAPDCVLYDVNPQSIKKVWKAVVLENPDIIYYPGLFCQPEVQGNSTAIRFEYFDADISLYNEKLDVLLSNIDKKLSPSASDYKVCKTIFDELASTVHYKRDVMDKFLRLKRENNSQLATFLTNHYSVFTPYGVVVNSEGVCQGISRLYKILCNRFGIECACVEAQTKNTQTGDEADHMLNVVEVNGSKVFVDATKGLMHKDVPVVRYDFFMCPSRIVAKELTIVDGPEDCDDDTINFYVRNGLRFKTINGLRRYLCAYVSSFENSEIKVQYDGENMSDSDLQTLCLNIMEAHCEEGKQIKLIVENGFCTGKIFDNAED